MTTCTASDPFTIKQGDTLPLLERTLQDANGAIDLSNAAAVRFHMYSGAAAKIDAACSVVAPATSGVVRYTWASADTDTVGTYYSEFEVTYLDGTVITVPNSGWMLVNVVGQLA